MQAYKLTRQDNTTYNNMLWGENVTHEASGKGQLCSAGWLHFYDCKYLAVIFNINHANFNSPKLWEAIAEGEIKTDLGRKFGCTKLTTIKEIPLPEISLNQKIVFGILCSKEVYKETKWNQWADNWLSGLDRTNAANAAAAAYAANAAANAAYAAAADAAYADAAANAAAAYAANAAAAYAAYALDFKSIIKKALTYH